MAQRYSQSRALWAINRASFKAILAQPIAIIFSILFPIIFTMIFGAFGEGGGSSYRIALSPDCDTNNLFYSALKLDPSIRIDQYSDSNELNKDFAKGSLAAILRIESEKDSLQRVRFIVHTRSTSASVVSFEGLKHELDYVKLKLEKEVNNKGSEVVTIAKPEIATVWKYKPIDFILPGQLGFSILFSTLFGIAILFYSLREQLVLKRFFATPVSKLNILIGIGSSRLMFQLISVIILIVFGHFLFGFSLRNGIVTVVEILAMSIVMLFLLMGVAFIFGSIAKNDSYIPLFINLFAFPQMMLSGTFFPIDVFPKLLQGICRALPLTQYNEAIRKISFEGLHIWDCGRQLGILAIWIVVIYSIAVRVLKWE